jgi:diguanylate cyclase (GGDEF)-like protein/PAS domain S-box-containing protein
VLADPVPADIGRAVERLRATGLPDVDEARLARASRALVAHPGPRTLGRLRGTVAEMGARIDVRSSRTDMLASLIYVGLLVVVSIGWFVWFRKLVRRHRDLEHELTAREAQHAGERRLSALVQNSTDLVAVLEPDSTVSFASPAAADILGVAPEELCGRRILEVLEEDDRRFLADMLLAHRDGEHAVKLGATHASGRALVTEGTLSNLTRDPAVRGWVLTLRDVTERESLTAQLEHQAFHDALTELPNRQLFADRLGHALRRRPDIPRPLTVLFCDLDDFKDINDTLGHGIGDQALVEVAARITAALRDGDTAARLGGDEFAVLLEYADLAEGRQVAERIQQQLLEPVLTDDGPWRVRASIGIAEAVPGQVNSHEVLRNADVAMYWAKESGKAGIVVYDEHRHAQSVDKLLLSSQLEQAIDSGQLVLHFQPTVALHGERITGFEALVRWQHPERGLLPPGQFVPLAEQSGLIVALGRWVLREACRAVASMKSAHSSPTVAVNVAPRQLAAPDFLAEVTGALHAAGLPADRLVVEITETAIFEDLTATSKVLASLRELGVRVAIDDFGTGYSSLSYLSDLPVDILKVDKSFIDRVCTGEQGQSLTSAILTMSQAMGLQTVAEGVEQREQADWLQHANCALGQGYLWSRPLPLEQAKELLEAPNHLTDAPA